MSERRNAARTRTRWALVAAALLATAGLLGVAIATAPAAEAGPWFGGPRHGEHGFDEDHVRYAAAFVLGRVDASDAQIDAIVAIAIAAHEDLEGLRGEHEAFRTDFEAALVADEVDRDALEALRQRVLATGDAASQRALTALADAAAVLTREQRVALLEEHAQHRSHFARRHRWH